MQSDFFFVCFSLPACREVRCDRFGDIFRVPHFQGLGVRTGKFHKISRQKRCAKTKMSRNFHPARGGVVVLRNCFLQENAWLRSYRETNQHHRLPRNLVIHGFLHPSACPELLMQYSKERIIIHIWSAMILFSFFCFARPCSINRELVPVVSHGFEGFNGEETYISSCEGVDA